MRAIVRDSWDNNRYNSHESTTPYESSNAVSLPSVPTRTGGVVAPQAGRGQRVDASPGHAATLLQRGGLRPGNGAATRLGNTLAEDISSADQIWHTATWIQELSRYTTLYHGDGLWMGTEGLTATWSRAMLSRSRSVVSVPSEIMEW